MKKWKPRPVAATINATADATIQTVRFDRTLVLVGLGEEFCGCSGCDALRHGPSVDPALAADLRRLRVNGVVLQHSDHEPAIGHPRLCEPESGARKAFSGRYAGRRCVSVPRALFEREDALPIVFHVDHNPMVRCRGVQGFFEATKGCVPIVGVFAFRVGVVDKEAKAGAP